MREWMIAMLVISGFLLVRDMAKVFWGERQSLQVESIYENHPQKKKMIQYAESFERLSESFYRLSNTSDLNQIAMAEQMATPVPGKLVPREITRIISAGTLADMSLLDASEHNYIAACFHDKNSWGLACADHTTGEFTVADYPSQEALSEEVARIQPRELLISQEQAEDFPGMPVTLLYDGYTFLPGLADTFLKSHFRVHSLEGFG